MVRLRGSPIRSDDPDPTVHVGVAVLIYTDGIHLISDTSLEELQVFGERLGLKRSWIHYTPGRPHYDLVSDDIRQRAISTGAKRVGRRELVAALRRHPLYQAWQLDRDTQSSADTNPVD